jgi:spoIIIJ-associated protein
MTITGKEFNREAAAAALQKYLEGVISHSGFRLKIEIRHTTGQFERDYENPDLVVDFSGADSGLLLENKAELLRAIEHVAMEALDREHGLHERVIFDCQEYRMLRFQELALAAQAAADKVKRTGVPYRFGAMSGRERRVIHMALRGDGEVHTESEGLGLNRQVVIHPRDAGKPVQPVGRPAGHRR